jgi:hypothetical protein
MMKFLAAKRAAMPFSSSEKGWQEDKIRAYGYIEFIVLSNVDPKG